MLVDVIQLRATGMKLTPEELAEARRFRGILTFHQETAYLSHDQNYPVSRVLTPLIRARVVKISGDRMLIYGHQPADYVRSIAGHPQAWACYLVEPTLEAAMA